MCETKEKNFCIKRFPAQGESKLICMQLNSILLLKWVCYENTVKSFEKCIYYYQESVNMVWKSFQIFMARLWWKADCTNSKRWFGKLRRWETPEFVWDSKDKKTEKSLDKICSRQKLSQKSGHHVLQCLRKECDTREESKWSIFNTWHQIPETSTIIWFWYRACKFVHLLRLTKSTISSSWSRRSVKKWKKLS